MPPRGQGYSQGYTPEHSTVVNVHVSGLMPVFLSDELNFEWDSRLSSPRAFLL